MGAAAMAATSCSDTWDEHYSAGEGNSATMTLWQQIQANPNLSKFAAIAEKAYYYKDETHPQAGYTFKDMLSGTQLLTVWAPENSAISEADYQKWLQLAQTDGYTVQQQLMGNSIALFRNLATGGIDTTLTMLNGKKFRFDKAAPSMAGITLNEKNIAATNGTLHTVGSVLPFNYNLYEYLKDEANTEVSKFHQLIIASDTTYFSANNSIEGNPDINGNPTYVDSVYFTTNTMFRGNKQFPSNTNTDQYLTYDESFGAQINVEDSAWVMVVPTDKAWEAAYNKLKKYYNYSPIYVDNEKANQGSTNVYREVSNPDSLAEKCIAMDILSPLCFNLNIQPNGAGRKGTWQMEDFVAQRGQGAEYLVNTFNDTIRTDASFDKSSIFTGKPVKMSNGYGFVTDEWAFPRKLYKPDLNIEVGWQSLYNTTKATGTATSFSFSRTNNLWCDTTGVVSEDNFYYIYPASASGNPKFEFRLVGTSSLSENQESEVMSGKYDIAVVLVPNYYMTSNDSTIAYTTGTNGTAAIVNGDTIPVKHKLTATLSYTNGNANGKDVTASSQVIDYDGTKVDTLVLFQDFEFPYSYKNLRQCYPVLTLTTKTTSAERKNGYSNDFCIDRILLISKEDE